MRFVLHSRYIEAYPRGDYRSYIHGAEYALTRVEGVHPEDQEGPVKDVRLGVFHPVVPARRFTGKRRRGRSVMS